MIHVHFKNIRAEILREINKAQNAIQVAVYWFTNQDLFDMLYQKLKEGIDVELIIHNDYINNRDAGLPFQQFIDAGGKFYFSDDDNPMHNKFCIIDKQVLINGSYNWTYYAESKNRENVLIIKEEKDVIEAFETEFLQLIEILKPLQSINRLTKFEVEENNLLRNRDYLAHDIIYQAKASNKPEMVKSAFEIAPQNLSVQKIANDLGLIKKYKLKSSIWVSIVNDAVKVIASRGASIPATFTTVVRTSYDNQTKSVTDIVYGEFNTASANEKLDTMSLDGLPQKPAGKAEVKFTFSVDIEGNVRIEKMSLDTGIKKVVSKDAKWLIEES
ncbi:MAG: phospholipase D-like domain-containing protein [bacterium]|nr:phospholipase D-like domain-containing protein [bacterium]